jgi:methylmalonyl-CoA mutase
MTDTSLTLGQDFSAPSYDDWKAEVEKALKGAPFDKKMLTRTYEGITLNPVYTRTDWPADGDPSGFPGAMPFTRGRTGAVNTQYGWDLRQVHVHPDVKTANENILTDVQRGATSLVLKLDHAAQAGLDGDAAEAAELAGEDGLMVYSVEDLDQVLAGVDLEAAPAAIEGGAQFLPAAALLAGLWRKRGIAPAAARGSFNADPLAALAARGSLPVPADVALARLGDLAAHTAATYRNVTAVKVDSAPYHQAGASETDDLAVSMATGVAYLRAMTAAGLDVDTACRQIAFAYEVGCDFFMSIAKLRAARKMWSRIAEASGASEEARGMTVHAVSAHRMMTQRDPWVNMLRVTIASFAGAVAGVDSVTAKAFDAAIRPADAFSRRVARNTQVTLQEESYLSKVIDPAGGSWYIESLTDQLARAAWGQFQAIERAGGIVAALESGLIRGWIDATWAEREKALARRKDQITGVSEFPNIHEKPVEKQDFDLAGFRAASSERLAKARGAGADAGAVAAAASGGSPGKLAEACVQAAANGATVGALAKALAADGGVTIAPFPQRRLASVFEALRDASDAHKERTGAFPGIFLANLGRIAQHTARATYAKNFFEVGGIQALPTEGFQDAESCAKAFAESGARIAVICGSDPQYEEMVAGFAPALKNAGCTRLFLAGNPGDKTQQYTDAGVDDFIYMGCNLLETLRATLAHLGVTDR